MDGIYHQFVNDEKQNHFIHAEIHRPHFVHSEGRTPKPIPKKATKKIRRKPTMTDAERIKRLEATSRRYSVQNRIPDMFTLQKEHKSSNKKSRSSSSSLGESNTGGTGHRGDKGYKGKSLEINGISDISDDEDGSSDEDTVGTGHKGGKGESWRKEDASPRTGGTGHRGDKGYKGKSLEINGISGDEDGSSDEDGGGTGHKGGKGALYRKSLKKNNDGKVRTYHENMICPIANREINAGISANNVLQNKREIYSKYL